MRKRVRDLVRLMNMANGEVFYIPMKDIRQIIKGEDDDGCDVYAVYTENYDVRGRIADIDLLSRLEEVELANANCDAYLKTKVGGSR